MEEEMEICSNCKREIPSVNYVMHSAHCHRNIAVCPKCKEPVPRSELPEHDRSEHSRVACQACGQLVESNSMAKHKAETCPHRRVTCVFCELELGARESADHENYCGSRTEKCEECGEFVMIKYRGLHLDSNHGFIKLTDEPGPPASWEPATPPKTINKLASSIRKPPSPALRASVNKRFSPAKRENHQPQVNTNQKTTEKTRDIDDRLLALRLAQQEMETFSTSTVPEFKTPPIATMRAFVTDSDDEEELAAALKEAPQGDAVQLPCEFCEVLVPASRLVLHQTGCRPDLARYKILGGRGTHAAAPMLHNDLAAPPKDTIPCDLCGTSVPSGKFLQHQFACEIQHLPSSTAKQASRPQALVMPLSGRALKVKSFVPPSSPPAKNLLSSTEEKTTAAKQTVQPADAKQNRVLDPPRMTNGGAIPKQKARTNTQGQVREEIQSPPSPFSVNNPRRHLEYKRNPLD